MNEEDTQAGIQLIPDLIKRLQFDVKNQPPDFLPAITQSIIILNGFLIGIHDAQFQQTKNLLNDLKHRRKGEGNQNGSGTKGK